MSVGAWFSLASVALGVSGAAFALVWARRLGRAEVRLARGVTLLAQALAAELKAVKRGEIGAFDREQRVEIRAFIEGKD